MDKLKHFIAGFCISLIVGLILYYGIGCTANFSKGAALLTAFLAGAIKETFDAIKAKSWTVRTWDVFDFLATSFGGLIGLAVVKAVAGTL